MRAGRRPRWPALLLVLTALGACLAEPERGADPVQDLDGRVHTPLAPASGRASVLVFVTTGCPIANGMAPEIQALVDDFADGPLDFYLVYVDPEAPRDALLEHSRQYGYSAPILADATQVLAERLGVTRTPEAAVITAGGELSYLGRINDRYGSLGRRRPAPTRNDLRLHLEALVAGRPVAPARTEAVGCLLPEPAPRGSGD